MNRRSMIRHSAQSGQAIVLIALGMVVLLGFVALAIDGGNFYNQRRIAQNAADVSSLAGLHYYYSNHSSNDQVLAEIIRVVAGNSIHDATASTHAYWLTKNGDYVNASTGAVITGSATGPLQSAAELTSGSTLMKPAAADGIRVHVEIQIATFIGGVIGQGYLAVQADGVAMQTLAGWQDTKIDYKNMSAWMGGGGCEPNPVLNIGDQGNSNSFDFGGNAYINGSGTKGTGNSNQGLFKQSDGTAYFSGSEGFDKGSGDIKTGWENPYGDSQPFPDFFYYQSTTSPRHLVEAEDFRPSLDAAYTQNYIYRDYMTVQEPAGYFHTLSISFAQQKLNSSADNGALLATAMATNGAGIYFVDGAVDISYSWTGDQAVVATGHVYFTAGGANSPVGYARSGWGMGLSVLAGQYPPAGKSTCAVSSTDPTWAPVFSKGSQQAGWSGILYAPNGLVDLSGNFNNGHSLGPVIARSMSTGNSSNANNQNFGICTDCWNRPPTYTYSLQQ